MKVKDPFHVFRHIGYMKEIILFFPCVLMLSTPPIFFPMINPSHILTKAGNTVVSGMPSDLL